MKIYFHRYQLHPKFKLNSLVSVVPQIREGALLKIQWSDGKTGYADLHPWVELGDLSLEQQLLQLKQKNLNSQLEQSLWLASRDAELRSKRKSIFARGVSVSNNYTLTDASLVSVDIFDEIKAAGFSTIKLKVGTKMSEEVELVSQLSLKNFRLRLDFNAQGSLKSFKEFVAQLTPQARTAIEYVEDPFEYNAEEWAEASQLLPLAMDSLSDRVQWPKAGGLLPFSVLVLKPAKHKVDEYVTRAFAHNLKIAVTSYMDHPVGTMHALGVAMELAERHPEIVLEAGCMTHNLYQPNEFSQQIETKGSTILNESGFGIGFDDILAKVSWTEL